VRSLLICCGPGAARRLDRLLPRTGAADGAGRPADPARLLRREDLAVCLSGEGPADADCDRDSGISTAADVVLAFEGFVTHRAERGAALRTALIEDFLAHGERCVERWRGSFRLMIAHGGVTRVYADHTASRPIFVAEDADGPLFSSHLAPLLAAIPRPAVDGAGLLHFLRDGRFFAGASLFREVRQLGAGRLHRTGPGPMRATGAEIAWYRYELEPQAAAVAELLPELKRRLDEAVLRHWRRAEAPALLLSGGYDSRYLLNTLADLVPRSQLRRLLTCLWGEANPDPDCDAAWARREALRHGLAFEFTTLRTDLPDLFGPVFEAQSGMTAHVVTHTDDFARCRELHRRGYRSLIRGDECFGPTGGPVRSPAEALARIGVNTLPHDMPWLAPDAPTAQWRAEHDAHLRRLSAVAADPNDVRDLLYHRERLPSFNAQLNAHRAPFLENHNPLLDADVLDLVRRLPRELRTDKSLFRLCFRHFFPTAGFAVGGNAFALGRLAREAAPAGFLAERLDRLPPPFAPGYFGPLAARLRAAARGDGPAPSDEEIRLLCRAVVLGHALDQAAAPAPVPARAPEPPTAPYADSAPPSSGPPR
jgi:asparagine synthetase B (glutamine-hydrolysing)